jgi:predicted DNA-binding transcriptional regulator YafY
MKTKKQNIKQKLPSRLSLPKTALPRIYRIDAEIASGKFPNSDDLSKMCEVSVPTISRDIEFMKDQLLAPIKYDSLNRGYFYTKKMYRLPAGFTSAEDLLALGMAKSILSLYRETPLYEASIQLLESIIAPISTDGNRDWLENRIVVPKIASAKIDANIWKTVVSGLKENRIIAFDYRGTVDEDYKNRIVHPYQLLFDSGIWYLYGFSEERKAIRTFSLSRMKNILLTKDTFTLPKNFDYTTSTGNSYFGVFSGQEVYNFTIDFSDDAIIYAKERQWADDQKIIETDEGITIKFSSTQYHKVLQWLLSCGCHAYPQKPKQLVDDWNYHVLEMRKMVVK